MIIYGWRGRERSIDRGQFDCPSCGEGSNYSYMRASRYFTLYFIPIFPIGTLGEWVRCEHCGNSFKPEILDAPAAKPKSRSEKIAERIREDLASGTPLEAAHLKMTNAGVDPKEAEQLVAAASGDDDLRRCDLCNLSFLENVKKCSGCGDRLVDRGLPS